jgi:hypothetical protein
MAWPAYRAGAEGENQMTAKPVLYSWSNFKGLSAELNAAAGERQSRLLLEVTGSASLARDEDARKYTGQPRRCRGQA